MRRLLLAIAGLAMVVPSFDSQVTVAQLPQSFPCDPDLPQTTTLVLDYLSDVDLRPYASALRESVKENWNLAMPDEARLPMRKKGCVTMAFSVSKEGKLANMKIVDSYGDQQMDDAAWQAIFLSSPFPALPTGAPSWVRFRFRFYYNPDVGPSASQVIESADALLAKSPLTAGNLPPLRSENPPPVRIDLIPVGGQTPRGLHTPTPTYTLPAGSAPVRGVVLLSLVVTKKGEAHHIKVLEGLNSVVDEAACKTVETWKFEPAMRRQAY
jgi:TonB family protein